MSLLFAEKAREKKKAKGRRKPRNSHKLHITLSFCLLVTEQDTCMEEIEFFPDFIRALMLTSFFVFIQAVQSDGKNNKTFFWWVHKLLLFFFLSISILNCSLWVNKIDSLTNDRSFYLNERYTNRMNSRNRYKKEKATYFYRRRQWQIFNESSQIRK